MSKIDLLPCPFCGSSRIGVYSKGKYVGMYFPLDSPKYYETYSARCNKCHARGSVCGGIVLGIGAQSPPSPPSEFTTREKLKAMAIAAWNTRASGFIPRSERMPEKDGDYLCVSNNEYKILPYRNGEFYCVCFDSVLRCCNSSVTHWMPLPEPPKRKDDTHDYD